MGLCQLVFFFGVFIFFHTGISGLYALSCSCGNIEKFKTLDCKCNTTNNVEWYYNSKTLSTCYSGTCYPDAVNGTTFSYTGSIHQISIPNFKLEDCKLYICKDLSSLEETVFPYCPVLTMTKPINAATVNIAENTTKEFQCEIRSGYPAGTVEWYTDSKTPGDIADDVKITTGIQSSSSTSPTDNQEHITTSTLSFAASRSDTGNRIYCKATNKLEQTPLISLRKPLINVLYYCVGPAIQEGKPYRVIENTQGQLTCTAIGGNPRPTIQWNCNNGNETKSSNGDTKTNTVTWTAQKGGSNSCTCESTQSGLDQRTASISIITLFPPSSPIFSVNGHQTSGNINIKENYSKQIECKSDGNPDPSIRWQKPASSSATKNGHILNFSKVLKTDKGSYTCDASNVMNPTGKSTVPGANSSVTQINVLYAPRMLLFYYDNLTGPFISDKTIDVIEGDAFKIACKSQDGEPIPSISWSGQSTNDPILSVQQITESQTWKTCTATNQMRETGSSNTEKGIKSDNITFNILIPPSIPGCKYYYNNKPNNVMNSPQTLMIKEGQSFTLTCDAVGKPSPAPMWTIPSSSSTSASVTLHNVTRHKRGIYAFSASSVLKPTFQPSRTIIANESVSVNILYPPRIVTLKDISLTRGDTLDITCLVHLGYPAETTIQWTRDIDGTTWNSAKLFIQSITSNDAGTYTCTASNVMKPSGESMPTVEMVKESFKLNVFYKARITSFLSIGFDGTNFVTLDEHAEMVLKCNVDSNPTPKVSLTTPTGLTFNEMSDSLTYKRNAIQYNDSGIYVCAAANQYNNGHSSYAILQIIVRCSPQPAHEVGVNKAALEKESFTFKFIAAAYPFPNFEWFKLSDNRWIKLNSNDANIQISTSALETNLTILHVESNDYGQYKLVSTNEMGSFEQRFHLAKPGLPDIPANIRQIESSLSSIQLGWEPGFDGGLPQSFHISYRKDSEQSWESVRVEDNGETTMNYTLSGLEEYTKYDITIYAYNMVGKSDSQMLLANTQGCALADVKESHTVAVIGAAIGGIMFGFFIGVLTLYAIRRFGNDISCANLCSTKRSSENCTENDNTVLDDVQYTESDAIGTPAYEHLGDKSIRDVYSTLTSNPDRSGESKSYENLHLTAIQHSD